MLARVYSVQNGPFDGSWFWTVADGKELGSGIAVDRDTASRKAEAIYFSRFKFRPA